MFWCLKRQKINEKEAEDDLGFVSSFSDRARERGWVKEKSMGMPKREKIIDIYAALDRGKVKNNFKKYEKTFDRRNQI